jgi:superfamily I DNA/RNA helicase
MNLYMDVNFEKSVPREDKAALAKILEELERALKKGHAELTGFLRDRDSAKFPDMANTNKFRGKGSIENSRIAFEYISDGINLIKYIPGSKHDTQSKIVRRFSPKKTIPYSSDNKLRLPEDDSPANFTYDAENAIIIRLDGADFEKALSGEYSEFPVKLNTQQNACVNFPLPLLISGSAGSGKSLVALHALNKHRQDNPGETRFLYMTLSSGLREKAKRDFLIYADEPDEGTAPIEFADIKGFCAKTLGLADNRYIDFRIFEKDFFRRHPGTSLDPIDVWTEIRGVIKGKMDENWNNAAYFDQHDYSRETMDLLRANNCLDRNPGNKRQYRPKQQFLSGTMRLSDSLGDMRDDAIAKEAAGIESSYKYGYSRSKKYLDQYEYLSIGKEVSPYNEKAREEIYRIFEDYNEWMRQRGFLDDNDLVHEIICGILRTGAPAVDFLAVDEVQDFTERQLFMFFLLLPREQKSMILSGDENQIINPTIYSGQRAKQLFRMNKLKLNEFSLDKNYRSQGRIISLSNELSKARRRLIGSGKAEYEVEDIAIRGGNHPFVIEYNNDNIAEMIASMNSRSAIIVGNEATRRQLLAKFPSIEKQVYTVFDSKGLEFRNVFIFDMLTEHRNAWDEIFSGDPKVKHNTRYRFYFNAFYVALTRATDNLCLIEEKMPAKLHEKIRGHLCDKRKFNRDDVAGDRDYNSPEDWRKRGRQLETNGDYERAVAYYAQGAADDKTIWNCEALYQKQMHEYRNAAISFVKAEKYPEARECAELSGEKRLIAISKQFCALSGNSAYIAPEAFSNIQEFFAKDADHVVSMLFSMLSKAISNNVAETSKAIDKFRGSG